MSRQGRCDAHLDTLGSRGRWRCVKVEGHEGAHELIDGRTWADLPPAPPRIRVAQPRDEVLDTAKELISGERAQTYGDATESHRRIGKIWGAILGIDPIPPATVALLMAGLKISRAVGQPDHLDSYVDMAGYAALGYEAAVRDGESS